MVLNILACFSECLQGVGSEVKKYIHLCCGYPSYLDQTDYLKADPDSYQQCAIKLDNMGFDGSKCL